MPRKRIIFIDHALERMLERRITRAEARSTIESPEITTPGWAGRTNYWKAIHGRRIRITVAETAGATVVVTVALADEDTGGS